MAIRNLMSPRSRVVKILNAISQPSAPFYESHVKTAIRRILEPLAGHPGVQMMEDRYGNLLATFWNAKGKALPCLTVVAHMDHPGFDPLEIDGLRMKAEVLGGLPSGDDLINTPVLIISGERHYRGRVTGYAGEDKKKVWLEFDEPISGDCACMFGVPDMERFKVDTPFIYGRAMDDLAGCAIQLAVMEWIVKKNIPIDFMAVFHRAEEVGFIGAQGVCELRSVPPHAFIVCLEASKHVECAQAGEGVVIRTGDRLYEFDRNAQRLLETAAKTAAASGLKTQQARMEGGVCEASLYLAHGYETTALAVPLIHYHNHGQGKLEPEAIHIYDLNSAVELLTKAAELLPDFKHLSRIYLIEDRKKRFNEMKHRLTGLDKGS